MRGARNFGTCAQCGTTVSLRSHCDDTRQSIPFRHKRPRKPSRGLKPGPALVWCDGNLYAVPPAERGLEK